ncbi:MAG TPA: trigger factor [Hyphomicrobiales bacterium]|nr:trigger factor [Hyphomicrobiales bacterium]
MQVSIESLSSLERKMTIAVPPERVESQVEARLQEAARTVSLKGFRKGKVPLKVVRERYGKGVRQEVLGEVMSQTYYEALGQEKVRPASQPRIKPVSMDTEKGLEFEAYFEVYPEVALGDFAAISIERKTAEITDADIDNMIETLRKQRQGWQDSGEAAREGDQVTIDFVGTLDGEAFEGGSAEGVKLVLGSKRMIEGFEAGLVGVKADEERTLDLSFPQDYHKQDLAGKPVQFAVKVAQVEAPQLPELDDAFFASFDVKDGGMDAFRNEVRTNMARELKNAVRNNVRNQVVEGLVKLHTLELPKALVTGEIEGLRQQAVQQYGGGRGQKIDASVLPDDLFRAQAERRVSLGLIMNEVIQQKGIKVDPDAVRKLIEELAESYEQPQEVISWYYGNKDQLAQVEAMALEEAVIDQVLEAATVNETACSYEEALKPSTVPQSSEG